MKPLGKGVVGCPALPLIFGAAEGIIILIRFPLLFQCKHWFILPWIVCDFIVLAALTVFCVVVVIVMGVYKPEGEDSSDCIAYGVILAVIMGNKNILMFNDPVAFFPKYVKEGKYPRFWSSISLQHFHKKKFPFLNYTLNRLPGNILVWKKTNVLK